jgi:flagellar motility protein MotE (MotC chaperone)
MSFVERHMSMLLTAVAAMIALRIFGIVTFESLGAEIHDRGFLQIPIRFYQTDSKQSSLADMITSAIKRQRSPQFYASTYDAEIITGSTGSSEGAKPAEGASEPDAKGEAKAAKPSSASTQDATPLPQVPATETAEKSLLEKLGLRRTSELKVMETELQAKVDAMNAERQGLKPIIVMYETMKPKDAAKLFEKLDLTVLIPLAKGMNPRKLADVLAITEPVLASKITKSLSGLASAPPDPKLRSAADVSNELPDYSKQGTE